MSFSATAPITKTQFYSANGAGRDSYIHGNNGGFCPPKEPCKIDDLGKCRSPSPSLEAAYSSFLLTLMSLSYSFLLLPLLVFSCV